MDRRAFLRTTAYGLASLVSGSVLNSCGKYLTPKYLTPDEVAIEIAEAMGRRDVNGVAKYVLTLGDIARLGNSDDRRHKEVAKLLLNSGSFDDCDYDSIVKELGEEKDDWREMELEIKEVGYSFEIGFSGSTRSEFLRNFYISGASAGREASKNAIGANVWASDLVERVNYYFPSKFVNIPGRGWKCYDWRFD